VGLIITAMMSDLSANRQAGSRQESRAREWFLALRIRDAGRAGQLGSGEPP
jgi:hypothetical protein